MHNLHLQICTTDQVKQLPHKFASWVMPTYPQIGQLFTVDCIVSAANEITGFTHKYKSFNPPFTRGKMGFRCDLSN